jgi:hypothetical protein
MDKRIHFFDFFFFNNRRGIKILDLSGNLNRILAGINRVMGPIPDWPLHNLSHVLDTPTSSGVTNPNPVTTTRRGDHSVIEELHTHNAWKTLRLNQRISPSMPTINH